jgi:dihydrofolate synthase/folylpolyglutamate synthase
MNYQEALEYIHGTVKFGSKLGLKNITELLKRLDDPHKAFPSVHVAGTNGKGSVTSMTAKMLHKAGYKVGMFISPYLERFTERIQVNFEEIPQDDLARLTRLVREKVNEMVRDGFNHPTEFEIVTTLGFLYFAEQKVDIAVVEVGLGGRLDSTNVITPLVSVITSISFDHVNVLGDSLREIAFEKGGIIKPEVPIVSYPQDREAAEVIEDLAKQRNAPYYPVDANKIKEKYSTFREQCFDFHCKEQTFKDIRIHLPGKHQMLNAACAITAVMVLRDKGFVVSDDMIYEGMESAHWPGRLELIKENPTVILDGAHNPSGAKALADAIGLYFADKKVHLILGVLKGKDADNVAKILCSVASDIIITKADSPRGLETSELADIVRKYHSQIEIQPRARDAISVGINRIRDESEDSILVISGSLYLIGEARTILLTNQY